MVEGDERDDGRRSAVARWMGMRVLGSRRARRGEKRVGLVANGASGVVKRGRSRGSRSHLAVELRGGELLPGLESAVELAVVLWGAVEPGRGGVLRPAGRPASEVRPRVRGEELVVPIRSARGRRGGREYSFAKGCALVRIARERSSRCPRRARTSRRARCSRARDRHRARRSGVQHPRVGEDVDQVFLSTLSDFFLALRFGNPKAPQSVVCHLHCMHILVLSRNRSCGRSSERRAGSIPRSVLLRFASTRYWYFPLNNRPTFRSLFVSRILARRAAVPWWPPPLPSSAWAPPWTPNSCFP